MSELTDLQICRRIAEIEGYEYISEYHGKIMVSRCNGYNDSKEEFNPLSKNQWQQGLCFQLMVKHKVKVVYEHSPDYYHALTGFGDDKACQGDKSPSKAICLAIIEAHKND